MKGIIMRVLIMALFVSVLSTSHAPVVTTEQVFSNPDGKSMYIITVVSDEQLDYSVSPEVHLVDKNTIVKDGVYQTVLIIVIPTCGARITATGTSTYQIFTRQCAYVPVVIRR